MHKDNSTDARSPTLAVPSGRGSRLVRLGWMATGIAGGMVAEGARQLARGNRPYRAAMLLQRKFGGLYLLAIRLKARVDLHAVAQAALGSRKRSLQSNA